MMKPLKAIMIDPETQQVRELTVDDSVKAFREALGIDGHIEPFRIAMHDGKGFDYGWVDETGLSRGQPIYAFRFDINPRTIIGGKCLISAADLMGDGIDVLTPAVFFREHIEWLGLILPEVTTVQSGLVTEMIVTYSRVQ